MSNYQNENTLYYIDALLKYSNYGKAAQSLYISQPYLTQVIKRIEQQLNCQIINRSDLPYRLTEQGKIYYEYLSALENNRARLIRDISEISNRHLQMIKIGVLPSLGTYLLPLFIPKFLARYPHCHIDLIEDVAEANEKRLQKGEIDFWLGQNSRNISPNLETISWGKHRYYAIIPKSCDLYQKGMSRLPQGSLEIKELLKKDLVLTAKGSSIRMQVDQLINLHKVSPNIIIESSEIHTVQQLAMLNMGVTFVPESLHVEENPDLYNIYPLPIQEMNLDYFIAHDTNRKLSELDIALIDSFLLDREESSSKGE